MPPLLERMLRVLGVMCLLCRLCIQGLLYRGLLCCRLVVEEKE